MEINWDAMIDKLAVDWSKQNGYGLNGDFTQGVCIVGALCAVSNDHWIINARHAIAESVLPAVVVSQYPERIGCQDSVNAVERFNDHEDTTLEDVIMVCEKARASETL